MSSDVLEQLRKAFKAEALDLLVELDSSLLALEDDSADPALVHRVFRAIHTLKGSGGTAGFKHLARFTHSLEEAFDLARAGQLAVTPELVDCGLKACDVIRLILAETEEATVAGEDEVIELLSHLAPAAAHFSGAPALGGGKTGGVTGDPSGSSPAGAAYEIFVKPKPGFFYSGADPVTLLDDLRALGTAHITAHVDSVPPLASLDPEQCYLWWDILLVTDASPEELEAVFEFVEDECERSIQLVADQAGAVAILGSILPESLHLFRVECEEILQQVENDALSLESELRSLPQGRALAGDPGSRHRLDALFRGVHSLKGNAGVLLGQVNVSRLRRTHPLPLLHRIAHAIESLLNPHRNPEAEPVPAATIQTVLETCDTMRSLLGSLTQSIPALPPCAELLERLGVREKDEETEAADEARSAAFRNTTSQCVEMIAGCFERLQPGLETRPVLEAYLRGVRTLSAAAQYQKLTELHVPLAEQLQILDAAVRGDGRLGPGQQTALSAAFRSTCSILGHVGGVPDAIGSGGGERNGGDSASCTAKPLAGPTLGAGPVAAKALNPQAKTAPEGPASAPASSTIRIDQEKVDRLMRVVGELLVARGAFPLLVQKLAQGGDSAAVARDLKEAAATISRISDELQNSVMSIRMLPVKMAFQKFPRLVRDLARSLGKEVRLVMEGESIELDKTILEQIGDPLVHVVRNSVDHGLETPAERVEAAKDPTGQVTLRASHESGGIVIEVADDGRGLNADALKRKAVASQLITEEAAAAMSEEAAFQLIFLPGLSTAQKVTDVSGRGVGMDVVRSNVRNLQGTVELRSKRGQGTALRIKLPTSLMISKGILLLAGGQEYILPLSNIRDMVKISKREAHQYRDVTLAQVRNSIYPIFSLARILGLTGSDQTELSLAIVEAGTATYGLIVDRFVTEVEVLVKPLTGGLERCTEFQGAAIMGDGRVVLVLNALECHRLERQYATN